MSGLDRRTDAKPRTRLAPEARRKHLLDAARELIRDDGLQQFSMESLARTARVSSPLIYNYFSSRGDLLRGLLIAEYDACADQLASELAQATTFEEIVKVFISSNFDHYAPGNVIPILESQPEIATAIAERSARQGTKIARYLVRHTAEQFHLSRAQAEIVVRMSSGASIAAAQYAALGRIHRRKAMTTALAYVMAGVAEIASQNRPSAVS